MPSFEVAHVKEQGVDLIITVVNESFEFQNDDKQDGITAELQARASSAGLAGTVVPVWMRNDQLHFRAPPNWHAFFRSLNPLDLAASINRKLYW